MHLTDGGTIAWIVGAIVTLVVVGSVVAFALWESEQ